MIYRHSEIMTVIADRLPVNVRQLSRVYPTVNGACFIVVDDTNGVIYRMHLDKIESVKTVINENELYYSDFTKTTGEK